MWNWNPDPHIDKAICTLSRYDIDGNYRDTIKMDGQFQSCVGLTMLDRDRFILTAEALDGTPFTGVYQTNGQFLHKLTLPNDLRVAPKNKKLEDMGSLEVPDSRAFEDIMSFTSLDNDGLGNVYIFRRDPQSLRNNKIPQVVFRIDRNEQVTRFQLKQPTSKIGNFVALRAANDHVISLQTIQDDISEWAKGEIVVYDSRGKVVADNWYVARDFGFMLLGWNEHRALFGTQAGDPNLKVKHFGIIEGLMQ